MSTLYKRGRAKNPLPLLFNIGFTRRKIFILVLVDHKMSNCETAVL